MRFSMRRPFGAAAFAACCLLIVLSVEPSRGEEQMTIQITSTAFTHEGEIPARCTCEGEDISPALSWSGVPESQPRPLC